MIPLSVPNLTGNELKYVTECLETNWVSSVGSYVTLFENSIAKFTRAKFAVATSNGTSALHIALLLSGVEQNDFVIVPNLTFVASVNSVKYCCADPILMDVNAETWQMDLNLLEEFLSKETIVKNKNCIHKKSKRRIKAIMPVHILGNLCDMKRLINISKKYYLEVVEDATEALGSSYSKKHAGTFGKFGCFSFNGNKIITTGGGGMIVTNNEKLAKRAKHITTQAKSDSFEYIHDEVGYNYRLVNILAAMGVAQMEQLPKFLARKNEIAEQYNAAFLKIKGVKPQHVDVPVQSNNWLHTLIVPHQKGLMKYLLSNNIEVRPLWKPMNKLNMFAKNIYVEKQDVCGKLYTSCISLPCSTGITNGQVERVISLVKKFYKQ